MTADQRLQRIAQIFDEVNRTYFDGVIPVPRFLLSTRMTRVAGAVQCDDWTMSISVPYFNRYGWEEALVATIKHEAIHLYLAHRGRPHGHTKEFNAQCLRIGASRWSMSMPRRRLRYRYLVHCPKCGKQWSLGRWRRDLACSVCCKTYNKGKYTPEFVLTLVKRETLGRRV
jgi:predicted SprT family Zn-dependent metalloprotease